MASAMDVFEDKMMVISEVVGDNIYLSAIKDAFTAFMPFVIVGSFGSLLNYVICSTEVGLGIWFPGLAVLSPAFTAINYCTMSFITVPITFLIGMYLARAKKAPEYASGLVSVAAYISMICSTITVEGTDTTVSGLLTTQMGSQGLFVGMFTALVFTSLFAWLCSIEQLKIKLPPEVPSGIAASFDVMIPAAIVIIVSSLFGLGFLAIVGSYINDWIYTLMQAPLEAAFKTPFGIITIVIVSQFFWALGIHGGLIVSAVRNPMWAAAIAANTAAFAAGTTPDSPFTQGFWMCFVAQGGAGMTLCLIFALLLFSKRDDERAIAKLGLAPGIFGVSEPVVFGIPLVLNPTYFIPFAFNSAISVAIALGAIKIGFLTCNIFDVPFGIPILLQAFLSFGWQGVVVQAIIFVVCTLVWVPFVMVSNRMYAKQKAAEAEAELA